MALFGGERDISLFRHINRELINDIVQQQLGIYKLELSATTSNIYGESMEKTYRDPVLINGLILRGDQNITDSEFGPDLTRDFQFAVLRDDLVDVDLVCEIGDIVLWNDLYFEVHQIVENQLFVGKNPDYAYGDNAYLKKYGTSISIRLDAHLVRPDVVGIQQTRL
jgi:hypothetical protein